MNDGNWLTVATHFRTLVMVLKYTNADQGVGQEHMHYKALKKI